MGTVDSLSQLGSSTDASATSANSAKRHKLRRSRLVGVNAFLMLFMIIYCARPEDWIPGLAVVPLGKIAALLALLAFGLSLKDARWPLPREVTYLLLLIGQLLAAAIMSPIWAGGALQETLDFAKIGIIVIVMVSAVNTAKRLRRVIFIQCASVAAIVGVTLLKGHLIQGRLEGALGNQYADPNDLALILIITMPLCFASLVLARGLWKLCWAVVLLMMTYVVFLTGSRGGFLALVVTVGVTLWEFGIQRRRYFILVIVALTGAGLWLSSGGLVVQRLKATFNPNENAVAAASSQAREQLFWRSIDVTMEHPLFGVGLGNFQKVSGNWHETHNAFTSVSAEGGIPAFVLYVLVLLAGFANVDKIRRVARGKRELSQWAGALRASLAGYVVGSSFLSVAYQFFPYFLVAYTTALLWIARSSVFDAIRLKSENRHTAAATLCPVGATNSFPQ
jgi:O-antigen ligase